jgi:hypothetical protein
MYDEIVLYGKPLEEQYARKSITCSIITPSKQFLGKISEDILHRALSASSISSYQRTLKFYQQFLRLYFPADPVVPIKIEQRYPSELVHLQTRQFVSNDIS